MRATRLTNSDAYFDEGRTTAIGLARYASEYLGAALLVDEHHGARLGYEFVSPVPAYFLASHAIELTLKAYLRHHGVTVRQLRSKTFGHNLHACFRKSKELGLLEIFSIHPDDLRALNLLSNLNEAHGLRYIRTGPKHFPSWAIVEPFAVRLHQVVAAHVGYHQTFAGTYGGYEAAAVKSATAALLEGSVTATAT